MNGATETGSAFNQETWVEGRDRLKKEAEQKQQLLTSAGASGNVPNNATTNVSGAINPQNTAATQTAPATAVSTPSIQLGGTISGGATGTDPALKDKFTYDKKLGSSYAGKDYNANTYGTMLGSITDGTYKKQDPFSTDYRKRLGV